MLSSNSRLLWTDFTVEKLNCKWARPEAWGFMAYPGPMLLNRTLTRPSLKLKVLSELGFLFHFALATFSLWGRQIIAIPQKNLCFGVVFFFFFCYYFALAIISFQSFRNQQECGKDRRRRQRIAKSRKGRNHEILITDIMYVNYDNFLLALEIDFSVSHGQSSCHHKM